MSARQDASPAPTLLARRLRELREERWPGRVTQLMLARAFGGGKALAVSTISTWESASAPGTPPEHRLRAYATFFATERSLAGGGRLLPDDELSAAERAERDALFKELLSLRAASSGDQEGLGSGLARRTWRFSDGAPVRLVCGEMPETERHRWASPSELNHTDLFSYADLDALVELFGHVRAENPANDVRFQRAADLAADDLSGHVVLLGGIWWNPAVRWFTRYIELPIKQVNDPDIKDGEVFEVTQDRRRRRFLPVVAEDDPAAGLLEDVGLFARMPNPVNAARTLTICGGVYSRGVVGSVRSLTDAQLRGRNEAYLASRFANTAQFGLLMRVPVLGGRTATPDLTIEHARLFEWPELAT